MLTLEMELSARTYGLLLAKQKKKKKERERDALDNLPFGVGHKKRARINTAANMIH
jgi:hypothetical protein